MGLYSIIPGFCGAPWAVGAPRIVPTFHPTSNGPVCSNSQKYIVWVKIIDFSFMPKIIRILSKDHEDIL